MIYYYGPILIMLIISIVHFVKAGKILLAFDKQRKTKFDNLDHITNVASITKYVFSFVQLKE